MRAGRLAGATLGSSGSREVAGQSLRDAHGIARDLGAAPLLAAIENLARQSRITLEIAPGAAASPADLNAAPGGGYDFTPREAEVLHLVASGWTNQQIADALFITRKTASVHVSNLLAKLRREQPRRGGRPRGPHRPGQGSGAGADRNRVYLSRDRSILPALTKLEDCASSLLLMDASHPDAQRDRSHDMDPNWKPAETEPNDVIDGTEAATNAAARPARLESPSRIGNRARVLGALVLGGIGGAAILGPLTTAAASPTPSTATAPSATSGTGTDADGDNDAGHPGGPGGPGGHVEAVTDTSVVAKAIGISEADLKTALAGGQTVAAVAKAHNVALQVVIDALVADGTGELAAQVASGSITQAQADAMKAQVLQRATDQANGTFGSH